MQKINAAQAVLNQNQEKNEKNEAVAVDLETEQTVNASQLSLNILEELLYKKTKKERVNNKKTLWPMPKPKHQRPQATRNGHDSRSNSNHGQEKSNRNLSNASSHKERSNSIKSRCHQSQSRGGTPQR